MPEGTDPDLPGGVVYDTVEEFISAMQTTLPDRCEAHLYHACDADYGDVWQCDLPTGHRGRHHAWGGGTGGGDGFDADCVEVLWHADGEQLQH